MELPSALSSNTLPDDDREAMAAQSQQEQGQVCTTQKLLAQTLQHSLSVLVFVLTCHAHQMMSCTYMLTLYSAASAIVNCLVQ